MRHKSILRHLRFIFSLDKDSNKDINKDRDNKLIIDAFRENNYSKVTLVEEEVVISSNLLALQEMKKLSFKDKQEVCPKDYHYLLKETNES
jgi:hypothetical protein